jgi:N-acyl-D-aspartate/D-glutamate deacylase
MAIARPRRRTRPHESAGARRHARRRGGRIHFAAIRARALCHTEELIALAAEGAKLGGIYATHMRSEGDAIIPAIDEAIRIGREAHVPGRNLAPQSRRPSELGTHAGDRRAYR